MPSPQSIVAIMARHGEPMTLARIGGPSVGVNAKAFEAAVSNLDGDIQQRERAFMFTDAEISAASWPGPPRKLDSITGADGLMYIIQSVDTRRDGATVLMHICRAKGDA
jgi:hypothetical protein